MRLIGSYVRHRRFHPSPERQGYRIWKKVPLEWGFPSRVPRDVPKPVRVPILVRSPYDSAHPCQHRRAVCAQGAPSGSKSRIGLGNSICDTPALRGEGGERSEPGGVCAADAALVERAPHPTRLPLAFARVRRATLPFQGRDKSGRASRYTELIRWIWYEFSVGRPSRHTLREREVRSGPVFA
jgi:hypothetical protein